MCITSLPYCPPRLSHEIHTLLHAFQPFRTDQTSSRSYPSSSSSFPPIPSPPWFICVHPCPTDPTTPSEVPSTCPNLEIRHPGFNGAKCLSCTKRALNAAVGVNEETKAKQVMIDKLREEIERLEKVVANMKRKLRHLGIGDGAAEDEEDEEGRQGQKELKEVLERSLGKAWGTVL